MQNLLRFLTPLIELDVRVCRIQLSDWFHAGHARFLLAFAYSFLWRVLMLSGVVRLIANSPHPPLLRKHPEPRPLLSTGITRLHRYYRPLRHPLQPGLSLTGFRLSPWTHHKGLPVLRTFPLCACRPLYPDGQWQVRMTVSFPTIRLPSPNDRRVGVHTVTFEASSRIYFRYGPRTRSSRLAGLLAKLRRIRCLLHRPRRFQVEPSMTSRSYQLSFPLSGTCTFARRTVILAVLQFCPL
jgi:hypothetical protein